MDSTSSLKTYFCIILTVQVMKRTIIIERMKTIIIKNIFMNVDALY